MKMLGKKLGSMKKLGKKVKVVGNVEGERSYYECLVRENEEEGGGSAATPTGTFVVYVGEERRRFAVPTGYLSHPLLKILLEKAYNEVVFEHRNGLVLPCSVNTFQQVLTAVESCNGRFDFANFVDEFL